MEFPILNQLKSKYNGKLHIGEERVFFLDDGKSQTQYQTLKFVLRDYEVFIIERKSAGSSSDFDGRPMEIRLRLKSKLLSRAYIKRREFDSAIVVVYKLFFPKKGGYSFSKNLIQLQRDSRFKKKLHQHDLFINSSSKENVARLEIHLRETVSNVEQIDSVLDLGIQIVKALDEENFKKHRKWFPNK